MKYLIYSFRSILYVYLGFLFSEDVDRHLQHTFRLLRTAMLVLKYEASLIFLWKVHRANYLTALPIKPVIKHILKILKGFYFE